MRCLEGSVIRGASFGWERLKNGRMKVLVSGDVVVDGDRGIVMIVRPIRRE